LSVAKFTYSFDNGELPTDFDNYFSDIASVHTSLQKYHLPRMQTSLGQLSLKYIGPKMWYDIPEKLKSLSPYSFRKSNKSALLSCQNYC